MKLFVQLFLASLFATALFGVPTSKAEPAAQQKVRIGVVLPLSGGLAEYGIAARNGILLAQHDFPEDLRNFEFHFEDSRYDNATTVTACKKLQTVDHVVLQYVWGYGPAAACAAIADPNRMPTLAVSSDPEVEKSRKYVVRFATSIEKHSAVLSKYLTSHDMKRIAIIAAEIPFFTGIIDGLKVRLNGGQRLVLVDRVRPDEMDLKTSLARVSKSGADAVGVFLMSGQIGQYYKTAAAIGVTAPTFGSDFFDSESEIASAPPAIRGSVFPAPDVTSDFREKYRSTYGTTAQLPYAANAYDFATLLAHMFPPAISSLSPDQIVAGFRNVHSATGASGKFEYRAEGEFSPGFDFNVVLKKVDPDGKIVLSNEP